MKRYVLIDRDGTLNKEVHYLSDPAHFELIPNAGHAVKALKDAGFGVIVITNQSGIARGYFTMATLDAIHQRMAQDLLAFGADIDGLYLCPHGPQDDCQCRKPLPGMVEQAVTDLHFDPRQSIMIGDKEVDVDLGQAVGAQTILVRTGHGQKAEAAGSKADYICDDLAAAVTLILSNQL